MIVNRCIAFIFILFCGVANAGYKGTDPTEMAKTFTPLNTGFFLYSSKPNQYFLSVEPICAGRSLMKVSFNKYPIEFGCWWYIGTQVYTYSVTTGVVKVNMDLLMVNDNFTGEEPKDF